MKKETKKKVIITMLIMVSIVTIFFVSKIFISKNKKVDINLKTENKRNNFAMYIQD